MNLWRGPESRCGPGSSLEETRVVRRELPRIVRELDVRRLLDIPCGDFAWMREVPLGLESYVGADVIARLVSENAERFGSTERSFVRLDILKDPLPRSDLILCRDCLDHFSFADVHRALGNVVASGSIYLLATTYPERSSNEDIRTGGWRPLNLQASPFGLPEPLMVINEDSRKPGYADKALGLWRVADISR